MCVRVSCPACSKPTFAGCGAHIEMVLGDVRPADRCQCRNQNQRDSGRGQAAAGRRPRRR